MLILTILIFILLGIGLIYILTIVYYAMKLQSHEIYFAEKQFEKCDLSKVKGINLNFFEEVTSELMIKGFRLAEDYKVEEYDEAYIKLLKHHHAGTEYYVRYLINDIENTIASIVFLKVYRIENGKKVSKHMVCMHYFSMETSLNNQKHIQSGMIYEPSLGSEVLQDLILGPHTECRLYEYEGNIKTLIEEHLVWGEQCKRRIGFDQMVTLNPLEDVLEHWWRRHYEMRKDIYKYNKIDQWYQLTLTYCIKVVLCEPFFQLCKRV